MTHYGLKVGSIIKIGNIIFRIRKITNKDIIIREVKPPVTAQARKKNDTISKDAVSKDAVGKDAVGKDADSDYERSEDLSPEERESALCGPEIGRMREEALFDETF